MPNPGPVDMSDCTRALLGGLFTEMDRGQMSSLRQLCLALITTDQTWGQDLVKLWRGKIESERENERERKRLREGKGEVEREREREE